MPIDKHWTAMSETQLRDIPGTVGVYEIGDQNRETIYIGYAGGRSAFGLRSAIGEHFSSGESNSVIRGQSLYFRYEVTTSYLIRRLELLAFHRSVAGRLPEANEASNEFLPPLPRFRHALPGSES